MASWFIRIAQAVSGPVPATVVSKVQRAIVRASEPLFQRYICL